MNDSEEKLERQAEEAVAMAEAAAEPVLEAAEPPAEAGAQSVTEAAEPVSDPVPEAVQDGAPTSVPVPAPDVSAETDEVLKAILEAIVYVTDEPLSAQQIAAALERPIDLVKRLLDELVSEYAQPYHGLSVREVAGGYKMATKAEHHEAVRAFVKKLTPPLKLSLAALETLAVIAYKQPVTAPEVMDIRGVQGAGVLKTLLDRKLVVESGRKNVVGKPILYKTTKEFLVQFGLKDLNELPSLKEFEELSRMSADEAAMETAAAPDAQTESVASVNTETAPSDAPAETPPTEKLSAETPESNTGVQVEAAEETKNG